MSGFSYAFWFDDSRNQEENEQVLEPSLGAVQSQIPPTISPSAFPFHAQDRFSPSLPPNSLEPSPFCMEESEPPRANPLIPELTPQMMPSPQALTARQCSHCGTTTLVWQQHPITHVPLCDACAVYLSQRSKQRLVDLLLAETRRNGSSEDGVSLEGTIQCPHCGTKRTSPSEENLEEMMVCDACGMYVQVRGQDRTNRVTEGWEEGDDSGITRNTVSKLCPRVAIVEILASAGTCVFTS
ncbi:unnamed protein product [Mycena citricolor]|uniref:GATA-type domain-containing protein n=1 Tax=Mycena citricolor TaxID=2018698 RepID=A0AAD2Q1Y0_9AGAR|nr:unnamed protein product [Mycena citricolor]